MTIQDRGTVTFGTTSYKLPCTSSEICDVQKLHIFNYQTLFSRRCGNHKREPNRHQCKQECIPVGCVPPAHWPYLRISSYPTHAPHPQSNHAHPPEQPHTHTPSPGATKHNPPGNHAHPPEQLCMPPGATTHVPPRSNHARPPRSNQAHPPQEQSCTPLPVDRQTPVKT